ncbi:unnamed protein product, partial [Candidula unifasciata]
AANSHYSHFKKPGPSGVRALPVNSKEFLEIGEEDVPEDEKFFFRYFTERASRLKDLGSDAESDSGSIGDDEFDAFLDGFEKDVDKDDLGDLDLDFAGDSHKSKAADRKKKQEQVSDDESLESDDFDEDDLGDEELAAEFQQEMEGLGMDNDEDDHDMENEPSNADEQLGSDGDLSLDDDNDDELKMMMEKGNGKKRKQQTVDSDEFAMMGKKPKKNKFDTSDLFASAEQFAHLLEEDAESGQISLGGSGDLRNKDKAAQKQLKWEAERDRWASGKMNKHGGHRKKDFKTGNKKFQNKRKK